MSFQETIRRDIEEAQRSKEELRLSVLRMLSAAVHNREIEKKGKTGEPQLTEEEITAVLRSEVKKRRDSIAEFSKGGRQDLAKKEAEELKILQVYLPQEIPDEEVETAVRRVVSEMGGVGGKDFGRVMGEAMKRVKGRASGERVAEIVKRTLGL